MTLLYWPPLALTLTTLLGAPWISWQPPPPPVVTPPAADVGAQARARIGLNAGWSFSLTQGSETQEPTRMAFDDSRWRRVELPHTWNALDGQDGGDDYVRDVGWYRRRLRVPAEYAGKRFYLEFAGANLVTEVWLNERYLGKHEGGYARFRFDATDAVVVGGRNLLVVRVDNRPHPDVAPLSGDFTFFGGIYRDVDLLVTDPLHIDTLDYGGPGVYITQSNVSRVAARLEIETLVVNHHAEAKTAIVASTIRTADGEIVKSLRSLVPLAAGERRRVVQSTLMTRPHLWNGRADPYLYRAEVEVGADGVTTDEVAQRFGLRSFSVDPATGFFLNGDAYDLRGVNRHQDRRDLGWAIGEAEHDEDMALIMEIGATALRLAHYQHDDYVYDLADRHGLVVWAELPLVNRVGASAAFSANAERQLTELIRQNYNHPSVVFWGLGNELKPDDPATNTLLARLDDLAEREDPGRLTAYAHCCNPDLGDLTKHTDTIAYNRYFGWYGGDIAAFAPWADRLHEAAPDYRIAVSEYGAGANPAHHEQDPLKRNSRADFHPEEYQTLFHESYWLAMEARPFLWGKFVWNMFDFAADHRHEGGQPGINDKGLVTHDRQVKKDAFYWYKANWSTEPVVYITSRRFEPRTEPTTDVKVYGNVGEVELLVNGVSLGVKASDDHRHLWRDVVLKPGVNTVEARGAGLVDRVSWTLADSAGPDATTVRINAGSTSPYTDPEGRVYQPDAHFGGGVSSSLDDRDLGGSTLDPLHRSYRYGDIDYHIPVANGRYRVYLKFIEPFWEEEGQRVFDVQAEGRQVITDLDIFERVGQYRALEIAFEVEVEDNLLELVFDASRDNPLVSAIAVVGR